MTNEMSFPKSIERESRKYKAGFRLKDLQNDRLVEFMDRL